MSDCEDVDTPPDGIRSTYEVTFTPPEVARVRAAAREAGATVTRYLHDLATKASARTEVVVHIEGASLDKARLRNLVEAEMLRLGGPGRFRR